MSATPFNYTYKVGGVGTTIRSDNISVSIMSETFEQGRLVAEALNRRYTDTRNDCNGKSAYFCNGVFMRTTGANTRYHAWDPSPTSITIGGVSFSYLRKDLGIQRFIANQTQGFIFKNNAASAQDGQRDVRVLCSYPSDASIDGRTTEKGCGPHSVYPSNSGPCATQTPVVDTIDRWKTHYYALGSALRNPHQCSFGADPAAFALSLAVRDHFWCRARSGLITMRSCSKHGRPVPRPRCLWRPFSTTTGRIAKSAWQVRSSYNVTISL